MRVILSGVTFAPVAPTRSNPLTRQAVTSS